MSELLIIISILFILASIICSLVSTIYFFIKGLSNRHYNIESDYNSDNKEIS